MWAKLGQTGRRGVAALLVLAAAGGLSTTDATGQAGVAPPLVVGPVNGPCFYSNTFGAPRSNNRVHEGVDIIAAQGIPLVAVVDGTISKLVYDKPETAGVGGGNYLRVRVADGSYYTYLHLLAFADGIALGSRVVAGQTIGYVGQTGSAGTPHLHFEVHPQGGPSVDPTPYVIAAGTCGPPSDKGVPKPKPVPLSPTVPLAPAVREGVVATVVAPVLDTTPGAPAPTPVVPTPVVPTPVLDTAPPQATVPVTPSPDSTLPSAPGSGRTGPVVFRSPGMIAADRVVGVTVVGFPGLPRDAASVTLAVTVSGTSDGRAAIWPCGQRSGLDRGIQLQPVVGGVGVVSEVTLAPGDGGRVCLVATTSFTLEIAVLELH